MSKLEVLSNLKHNGVRYQKGDVLEEELFTAEQGLKLVKDGVLAIKEDPTPPAQTAPDGFPQTEPPVQPPAPVNEPVAPVQPPQPPHVPAGATIIPVQPPTEPTPPAQPTPEQIAQDMASAGGSAPSQFS